MSELKTLVDEIHQRAQAPADAMLGIPPECYRSESLFALECQSIFLREWVCVGRVDQVPNAGDYRCVDVINEPLVMVRGEDDVVRVFSRVCRHRGMDIAQSKGTAKRFVCPYHAWTYDLEGCLVAAPHMEQSENFSSQQIRLPMFRTEIWNGFIFVNLDGGAKSLTDNLNGLEQRIGVYKLGELTTTHEQSYRCDWNWKIMVENFAECYHHLGTHAESVQPYYPSRNTVIESFDPAYVLSTVTAKLENFGDWEHLPPLLDSEDRTIVILVLYPALLVVVGNGAMWWMQILPDSPTSFELNVYQCAPKKVSEAARFKKLADEYFADFLKVNDEDMTVCRGVQRGLGSRFARSGPLSHLEEPLHRFYQYLSRQLLT